MKNLVILGASGNLGSQTIEIIKENKDKFNLVAFSVYSNISKIDEILNEFKDVKVVCVKSINEIKDKIIKYSNVKFVEGNEGLNYIASLKNNLVVNLLVGFVGLIPTIKAIEAKNDVALANKETLVVGGSIIMPLSKKNNVRIIPIDSEHSAIYQCLEKDNKVSRLLITASGGPFKDKTYYELSTVKVEQALAHPTWNMGKKVSIDSATMFNKAFEVIEAYHLFNVDVNNIEVLIHPQSIVHSLVEFDDGAIKGLLSVSDMKLPISYAINDSNRITNVIKKLDLADVGSLTFEKPNKNQMIPINLAINAIRIGKTYPTILNASDEEAVKLFLDRKIKFTDIYKLVNAAITNLFDENIELSIDNIIKVDSITREFIRSKYHDFISI